MAVANSDVKRSDTYNFYYISESRSYERDGLIVSKYVIITWCVLKDNKNNHLNFGKFMVTLNVLF